MTGKLLHISFHYHWKLDYARAVLKQHFNHSLVKWGCTSCSFGVYWYRAPSPTQCFPQFSQQVVVQFNLFPPFQMKNTIQLDFTYQKWRFILNIGKLPKENKRSFYEIKNIFLYTWQLQLNLYKWGYFILCRLSKHARAAVALFTFSRQPAI